MVASCPRGGRLLVQWPGCRSADSIRARRSAVEAFTRVPRCPPSRVADVRFSVFPLLHAQVPRAVTLTAGAGQQAQNNIKSELCTQLPVCSMRQGAKARRRRKQDRQREGTPAAAAPGEEYSYPTPWLFLACRIPLCTHITPPRERANAPVDAAYPRNAQHIIQPNAVRAHPFLGVAHADGLS